MPDTAARLHAGYSEEPAPAPVPVPVPAAPRQPAWAKSGDELMAKLDLHAQAIERHQRGGGMVM